MLSNTIYIENIKKTVYNREPTVPLRSKSLLNLLSRPLPDPYQTSTHPIPDHCLTFTHPIPDPYTTITHPIPDPYPTLTTLKGGIVKRNCKAELCFSQILTTLKNRRFLCVPSLSCSDLYYVERRNCVYNYLPNLGCSLIFFFIGSYFVSNQKSITNLIIDYPQNAWSSILYSLPKAELPVKIPLLTLSIISFSNWANSNNLIKFIDITNIFWVIITVTTSCLPNAKYKNYVIIFVDSVFIIYISNIVYFDYELLVLNYYQENIVILSSIITVISTISMTSYYLNKPLFIFGIISIFMGFICKLIGIYNYKYWATCIFHTLTAIGISLLLQLQEQNIPLHERYNIIIP
jgi:hypothetical protein